VSIFQVLQGIPEKAARIFRKKYSSSRNYQMGLGVEDGQVPYDGSRRILNSGYPAAATAAAPRSVFPRAQLTTGPKRLPASHR